MFDLLCSLRDGGPWGIAAAGHADAHSLFEMHTFTHRCMTRRHLIRNRRCCSSLAGHGKTYTIENRGKFRNVTCLQLSQNSSTPDVFRVQMPYCAIMSRFLMCP